MRDERIKTGMLSGIKVLDMSDEKGSFCSKLLVDMGARVIRIEKPGKIASQKMVPLPYNEYSSGINSTYLYHNNNKLGITLNIEKPEGRLLFLKLVKDNDIIIETFPVGYLKKNKLDFISLEKVNPGLIVASISGFGQNGPRKSYKSSDLIASAFGGHMYVSGSASNGPLKLFGDQSYYISSLFAAIGIIIAVRNRHISGKGAHLDISLQESVTATLEHVMPSFFSDGIIARRQGNLSWNSTSAILPCKDGYIHISLFHQWETLIEWVDSEGMSADLTEKKWLDEDFRRKNIEHVIRILSYWSKKHTVSELFKLGQLMHLPWSPIRTLTDLMICPQLKARNFFKSVSHPEPNTTIKYPGTPFTITDMEPRDNMGAPAKGQDNMTIYHNELGISEKDLDNLLNKNVI